MSRLRRLVVRQNVAGGLARHVVGNAVVVCAEGAMTAEAKALALSVGADPEHDLVVVDLPPDSPVSAWESLATLMPKGRRAVRLVIGGRSREAAALTGQWLSVRLKRTFVVPDGKVLMGAGGSLLVHSGPNSGWVRFRPGRAPQLEGKRFPRPRWETPALDDLVTGRPEMVTEPLPGGLWIRSAGDTEAVAKSRSRLVGGMAFQPDVLSIVVGGPDLPPVSLDDVAAFCRLLPVECRSRVRFVRYGPVALSGGTTFGHGLANLLGGEVVCYGGMPIGLPTSCEVFTVLPDGMLGWNTLAQQLAYRPQANPIPAAVPELRAYRGPMPGLTEIAPAVYACEPDVVVEVVQSGLWVRPSREVPNAARVRALPADPLEHVIAFEAADVEQAGRMRAVAEVVLARLDQSTRAVTKLVPATTVHSARVKDISRELTESGLAVLDQSVPTGVMAAPSEVPSPREESPGVRGATAAEPLSSKDTDPLVADPPDDEPDLSEDTFFVDNATVVHSPLKLRRVPPPDRAVEGKSERTA
jgi:hypothetical protein